VKRAEFCSGLLCAAFVAVWVAFGVLLVLIVTGVVTEL
jgi:hypothetical protein